MSNKFLDDAGVIYLFSKVKERDYQSDFELGYYDTITENDDESYTITRQTGYIVLDGVKNKFDRKSSAVTTNNIYFCNASQNYVEKPSSQGVVGNIISIYPTKSMNYLYSYDEYGIALFTDGSIAIGLTSSVSTLDEANAYLAQNPISIQYKLATATTEKVEKNHYARYNQRFILEHNKSEAERSATEGKVVHEKEIDSSLSSTSTNPVQNKVINSALDGKANKTDITDMAYVVDSSDNAVSLETYGTEGYYVVPTKTYVDTQLTDKQDKLVSGTNIKTINGSTILGSGDITISGGNGGNVGTDPSFNSVIVEQTGAENTGVKLYANRQGDLYSIKRADTSVNRKILTNSDIDPSKVVLTNKQQKISAVTLFESLYVGSDYWKASITANSNSNSEYYMILSANAGEFHFECPGKYNLNLITNQLTRHTTIYAPSKDGTIALLSDIPTIYGITQLYKHDYELENQVGDTIYVTCWSTQNTKIPLCDITRYAFSNVQVYNSSSEETIQVIKWGPSGFNFINDNGNIDGNAYTVIHYYIDGEPTTY